MRHAQNGTAPQTIGVRKGFTANKHLSYFALLQDLAPDPSPI